MPAEGPSREFRKLAENIIDVSWLLRIAREWMYANAVEQKKYSEKAIMAIWLLSVRSPLPLRSLARFLRLSTKRTEDALRPLEEDGLVVVHETTERRVEFTQRGKERLRELIDEDVLRYWSMFKAGGTHSAEVYQTVNSFASDIRRDVEFHVTTWVLGQPVESR